MIYHSEDLYIVFNKSVSNFDHNDSNNKIHYLSMASEIVNKNDVILSEYFEFRNDSTMSAIINSPSRDSAWCNITHGKYIGSCQNGNYGLGGWKIYEK